MNKSTGRRPWDDDERYLRAVLNRAGIPHRRGRLARIRAVLRRMTRR